MVTLWEAGVEGGSSKALKFKSLDLDYTNDFIHFKYFLKALQMLF